MSVLQVLFGFQGRIRRLQWWLASIGAFFATLVAIFLLTFVMLMVYRGNPEEMPDGLKAALGAGILLFYLLLVWMQLAIAVKRYHDRDHTGFWVLITLIPLGGIWAFIELGFLDGTQGPNRFGPSPKGIGGTDLARVFS